MPAHIQKYKILENRPPRSNCFFSCCQDYSEENSLNNIEPEIKNCSEGNSKNEISSKTSLSTSSTFEKIDYGKKLETLNSKNISLL